MIRRTFRCCKHPMRSVDASPALSLLSCCPSTSSVRRRLHYFLPALLPHKCFWTSCWILARHDHSLQGYMMVGHGRDAPLLGTAGILGGWSRKSASTRARTTTFTLKSDSPLLFFSPSASVPPACLSPCLPPSFRFFFSRCVRVCLARVFNFMIFGPSLSFCLFLFQFHLILTLTVFPSLFVTSPCAETSLSTLRCPWGWGVQRYAPDNHAGRLHTAGQRTVYEQQELGVQIIGPPLPSAATFGVGVTYL